MSGLADSTRNVVEKQNRKIVPLARAAAQRTTDPNRKKQLLQDIDELENVLPREVGQANAVLQDPDNRDKKKNLKDTTKLMEGIVGGIMDPAKYDPNLARGAAGGGDLSRMMNDLLANAERYNRNPNDLDAKRRLQEILENLPLDMLDTEA